VLINAGNTGVYVGFWATCTTFLGRKTVAKSTAIIFSGSMLGQFFAPPVFGWAMDVTGTKIAGLCIWGGVIILSFVNLNVFFFTYKAQQKALAVELEAKNQPA
jgi:MFS family permease